jgi:hypothetical protein
MSQTTVRNAILLIAISLVISIIVYFLDVWILSSNTPIPFKDALFFEGLLITLFGLITLLGSGGISRTSRAAAMLSSAAKAISDKDFIGPAEILERDAWRPKGFARMGLILLMTGIFLLVIYFGSSYIVH